MAARWPRPVFRDVAMTALRMLDVPKDLPDTTRSSRAEATAVHLTIYPATARGSRSVSSVTRPHGSGCILRHSAAGPGTSLGSLSGDAGFPDRRPFLTRVGTPVRAEGAGFSGDDAAGRAGGIGGQRVADRSSRETGWRAARIRRRVRSSRPARTASGCSLAPMTAQRSCWRGSTLRGALAPELARAGSVAGLEYDSRRVGKDFLFFAFPGVARRRPPVRARGDGERCARGGQRTAAARGFRRRHGSKWSTAGRRWPRRRAISIEHPDERVHFTGITGTNGKTTTAFLIDAILREAGKRHGTDRDHRIPAGGRGTAAPNTTPESLDMMRFAAELETARRHAPDHRSFLARPGAGPGLRLPFPYRRVHQSDARSSRFSPHHGRVRGRQAAAVFPAGRARAAMGGAERRRSGVPRRCAEDELRTICVRTLRRRRSAGGKYRSGFDGLALRSVSIEGARQPIESPLVGRINVSNILAAAGAG